MKTATFPSVRADVELREAIDRRRAEAALLAGGLAAIARTQKAGNGIPADDVIAKLEARLASARQALADKATQNLSHRGTNLDAARHQRENDYR
ncbi:hypothetical protein [Rubrivivax sp. A210]|uniref:hypothetical protein n=1 Tax=Rubrivivax sp. A210 TaxID=2772301 RepID=UPI001919B415|nr:hypothetical protein [Rubrivivax sp. A210]